MAAVSHRGLRFAYEISAQFCHSYTPEPLCSPQNRSTALKEALLKTRSYHSEITANTVEA